MSDNQLELMPIPTMGINGTITVETAEMEALFGIADLCVDSLDVSEKTRWIYKKHIGYYLGWLHAEGRSGAQRADFVAYKKHLLDRYSASTTSSYLSAARIFYKWLQSEGLASDITIGVKGPAKPRGFRKDPLSVDQTRRLLQVGEGDPDALRDRAIVSLLIHTGIRTIEAVRADVGDVRNVAGYSVLFVQGKGHDEKDEFVILTPATLKTLNEYMASRGTIGPDAPLFVSRSNRNLAGRLTTRSVSRIAKSRMEEAGIHSVRITAHSLRHTAITLALLGGATIQEAQAMARHSNLNTTMIYAHNIDRLETPAEAKIDIMLS